MQMGSTGWKPDSVICATGTTIKKAGSQEAFRSVDHDLPLSFARLAQQAGAQNFALVSSIGASVDSFFLYARVKGELERDVRQIGFHSLTILRPGIIEGQRDETRRAESLALKAFPCARPSETIPCQSRSDHGPRARECGRKSQAGLPL
jgi:uncharacterized protein YbjT (DUF2867 family)